MSSKSRSRRNVTEANVEAKEQPKPRRGTTWYAADVLRLYGRYLREDWKRERLKPAIPEKGKEYPQPPRQNLANEGPFRAFLRVASEPKYAEYEAVLMRVYVDKITGETTEERMTMERASEFEMALNASLDRVPFVDRGSRLEALDGWDALIPLVTCATCLGIHRITLGRWIEAGLGKEIRHGCAVVQKKGLHTLVNYLAAVEWKERHHQPAKVRTQPQKHKK